jgi:hypothetical protein
VFDVLWLHCACVVTLCFSSYAVLLWLRCAFVVTLCFCGYTMLLYPVYQFLETFKRFIKTSCRFCVYIYIYININFLLCCLLYLPAVDIL